MISKKYLIYDFESYSESSAMIKRSPFDQIKVNSEVSNEDISESLFEHNFSVCVCVYR